MAASKQQVNVFMSHRKQGKTQVAAAAKAGISERSARRIEREHGRDTGARDPIRLPAVWDEVAERLDRDPGLQSLTVLEWLQEQYPEHYPDKLLCTLQRRIRDWRARHGPGGDVPAGP